jgi:hypothetical protein
LHRYTQRFSAIIKPGSPRQQFDQTVPNGFCLFVREVDELQTDAIAILTRHTRTDLYAARGMNDTDLHLVPYLPPSLGLQKQTGLTQILGNSECGGILSAALHAKRYSNSGVPTTQVSFHLLSSLPSSQASPIRRKRQ